MNVLVLGAGLMGRAIAYDLCQFSDFKTITIADCSQQNLNSLKAFLPKKKTKYKRINLEKTREVQKIFQNADVAISAVPYVFNYKLALLAIETNTHFLDLGGNNDIVRKELNLSSRARKNKITIIPDCGLAPGLVSVITHDIVEQMDSVDSVNIRVGGLPVNPKPPLNYQIVFSPYGLINEYVEDALILDHEKIIKKKSMTEIEQIRFPQPFGMMEAFLTSGGCSTLPYTYRKKISYLDYKTIRYPGHCEKMKMLLNLGFADKNKITVRNHRIIPRDVLVTLLLKHLPNKGKDVVLLQVFGKGIKNGRSCSLTYSMIDYADERHGISAMMRTTGYPVSIIAQMIEQGVIKRHGVFCNEEIVPCDLFFTNLEKRKIHIQKKLQ